MNGIAYLACAHAVQPHRSPLKHSYRVIGPRHWCRQLEIAPTNVSQKHKKQNGYQGFYKPIHPLPLNLSGPMRSMSIGGLQCGLQNLKKNLQNISHNDTKSIASSTHLSANRSTMHNSFIANMWLTKSGSISTVSQTFASKDSNSRAVDYTFF